MTVDATTLAMALVPGGASSLGYRRVHPDPGEPFVVRTDLGGSLPSQRLRPLLAFVHLSDLHVTDVQSPARAEFLDRHGDPDSAFASVLGRVGTYRAQECLTYQVVEAMVRALRRLAGGPLTGTTIRFAISTGDATDNCQENELAAYIALLDGGGDVRPDSGDYARYEGVGSWPAYDERYWHPDGTPPGETDDLPRRRHGLPEIPGLLDACRAPFLATGLDVPWYAVYGNHDALFGGTLPPVGELAERAVGSDKPLDLDPDVDVVALLSGNETSPSSGAWGLLGGPMRSVTPDAHRRPVARAEWIRAHLSTTGSPVGHGYDESAARTGRAYYAFDAGPIRCLVLDTVNPEGGWQGSICGEQLAWMEDELIAGHGAYLDAAGNRIETAATDRLFVLFSHHTIETLINDFSPTGEVRHLGGEVVDLLLRFSHVVCWFNGHTHTHSVTAVTGPEGTGRGFWQVTTASHIDWPQQARVVELAIDEESGDLVVAATVVDHAGYADPRDGSLADPITLAGWSRELALNAWQGRHSRPDSAPAGGTSAAEPIGRGAASDRNVLLVRPAPFPLLDPSTSSRTRV